MTKIGRNDRCPCGSGHKYKLCCGRIATIVASPEAASVTPLSTVPTVPTVPTGSVPAVLVGTIAIRAGAARPEASPERRCGTCTACCEGWAEGTIRGHRMFPGRHCHYLGTGGCTIYEERPQSPCRDFVCGWLQRDSPFPESFRPDRIGVIVVPMQWRTRPAYVLLSAGVDPDDAMVAWMEAFARRTGSPFYYRRAGERLGYGPGAFQQEMADKVTRGDRLW